MTLLIALLLLSQTDAGFFAYFGTFCLWILHIGFHGDSK